jgi:hypothetical protein
MMHVFRVGLTAAGVVTVWNGIPASLGFVSVENVSSVMPLKPSPHLVGKHPSRLVVWALMQPMIMRALPILSPSVDVPWEFAFKSWNNVVELKSVSCKVDPARVVGEDS